jgi:xylulokinase/L-xylulokinase
MMRSVFEGLACSFYDCFQVFGDRTKNLYLSGGASVSPFVCQMFSDMLGKPARRIGKKEMGVLGIIRVLQVALGYAKDYSAFPRQDVTVFQPDEGRHAKYMEVYSLFKELQGTMEYFWKERNRIKF